MSTENQNDPRMWDYWSGKYGIDDAMSQYYGNVLAGSPELRMLLQIRRAAGSAVEAHMAQLAAEAERANPVGCAHDWWTKP